MFGLKIFLKICWKNNNKLLNLNKSYKMKASELRIGNLCQDKMSGAQLKVTGLKENDISFYVIDRDLFPLQPGWQAEPIKLTEEWLLKFGFTRHHADYANDVIYIKNVPDNTEFEWGVYPNGVGSGIQIKNRNLLKHVHQLQNLYFALTEEELTFKQQE